MVKPRGTLRRANNKLKGRRKCHRAVDIVVVTVVIVVVTVVIVVVTTVPGFVNVTDQFKMVTRGKPEFDL